MPVITGVEGWPTRALEEFATPAAEEVGIVTGELSVGKLAILTGVIDSVVKTCAELLVIVPMIADEDSGVDSDVLDV